MNAETTRVLIAARRPELRRELRSLVPLLGEGRPVELLEAVNCEEAIRHLRKPAPVDFMLLDLRFPGSAFNNVTQLKRRHPEMPVVVVSPDAHAGVAREMLERGAAAFIPQSTSAAVMLAALRLVLSGGTYVPPEVIGQCVARKRSPVASDPPRDPYAALGLTRRQSQVLALVLEGKPNKAISAELGLALGTVKNYVSTLLRTLGVRSRVEALVTLKRMAMI